MRRSLWRPVHLLAKAGRYLFFGLAGKCQTIERRAHRIISGPVIPVTLQSAWASDASAPRWWLVTTVRIIRRLAYKSKNLMDRAGHYSARVEGKATRLLAATDYSARLIESVSFETMFYGSIRFNVCPLKPALPALGRTGKVTLLLPALSEKSFFGGTASALIVAGMFAKVSGRSLRIIETIVHAEHVSLSGFFKLNGLSLRDEDIEIVDVSNRSHKVHAYVDMHPDDIFIASAWQDAHLLQRLPLATKFVYVIQDFEPIFYANGDVSLMAENTYRPENFIPLCNTRLIYEFMSSRYRHIEKAGLWFEPAVSRVGNGESARNTGKKKMFVYGRPHVERNLFYTVINAVNNVFNDGRLDSREWDICMAGQDNIADIALSSGLVIRNLGKMPLNEYVDLTKTIDLAVSLMMAPHPSYPVLEMASVGAAVVTTKYANKTDLGRYSKNIFMADLATEDIEAKIAEAASLSYDERIAALSSNRIGNDWDSALRDQVAAIVATLGSS